MRKNQTFELVLTSIFVALIFLLGMVPQIGYINIIPGNPVTIVHIPVLLAAILLPTKYFWLTGLAFGLTSLIQAAMTPIGLNVAFINPLVSVLPRVLFAFAVHYLFKLFVILKETKFGSQLVIGFTLLVTFFLIYYSAFINFSYLDQVWIHVIAWSVIVIFLGIYTYMFIKHGFKTLIVPSIFILGTLIHTALVLLMLATLGREAILTQFPNMSVFDALMLIVTFNGFTEAIFAALIGTPVFLSLQRVPIVQQKLAKF
ncbi:ECF transporter S component [Acholeplasma laidlawii]|uniref:ECF transporter S component n=1 Tax=Acholeplasma laidlawii TaxID=2148 RepID=UPI0021F6E42A|nr:ECF transporter S component [Acholeplasma laidlawii]